MALSENDRREADMPRLQIPAVDMEGLAAVMRRRAGVIVAVTAACAALSLAWSWLPAPQYVASGQLLLDMPAPADADKVLDNKIRLLKSRPVLDEVIAKHSLETDPLFGGKSKTVSYALLAGVGLVPAMDAHAMALRRLDRAVGIVRSGDSGMVNVNVVTSDRETSARIANALMESYLEGQGGAAEGAGGTSALAARLETLRTRLRDAEQRYESYRSETSSAVQPDLESQARKTSEQIAAAEARTADLRLVLNRLQSALQALDSGRIPDRIQDGAIVTFRSRYVAARQFESDLSQTLGPRHPDRVIAKLQVSDARRRLEQSIEDRARFVAGELARARSTTAQLKSRLAASTQNLKPSSDITARLKELERHVEVSRAAYQAVLSRSQQQRPENAGPRIVSVAAVPGASGRSFPAGAFLVSALTGLGLGISLAWLVELMQRSPTAKFR